MRLAAHFSWRTLSHYSDHFCCIPRSDQVMPSPCITLLEPTILLFHIYQLVSVHFIIHLIEVMHGSILESTCFIIVFMDEHQNDPNSRSESILACRWSAFLDVRLTCSTICLPLFSVIYSTGEWFEDSFLFFWTKNTASELSSGPTHVS